MTNIHKYCLVRMLPATFALLKTISLPFEHFHSTCHYESLALSQNTTIILPFASSESVIHLCKTGYAFFASTPEELCDFVLRNPYQSVPQTIGNHFFASDALANMKNKLQCIR